MLTEESLQYLARQHKKGVTPSKAASDLSITARHAGRLRHSHNMYFRAACRIMKKNGLVSLSAVKPKNRRCVHYECKYADAMWHMNWYELKDPRPKGLNPVTLLDDSSMTHIKSWKIILRYCAYFGTKTFDFQPYVLLVHSGCDADACPDHIRERGCPSES